MRLFAGDLRTTGASYLPDLCVDVVEGVDTLVIVGGATDMCITATALDAADKGYPTTCTPVKSPCVSMHLLFSEFTDMYLRLYCAHGCMLA